MSTPLNEYAPLERYGYDYACSTKSFLPLANQEEVVFNRVFQIFQRKNKSLPVILGLR